MAVAGTGRARISEFLHITTLIGMMVLAIVITLANARNTVEEEGLAQLINLSGKQRMLTTRLALAAAEIRADLAHGGTPSPHIWIADAAAELRSISEIVINAGHQDSETRAMLLGPTDRIEEDLGTLLAMADALVAAVASHDRDRMEIAAAELRAIASFEFVAGLDRLTGRFQARSQMLADLNRNRLVVIGILSVLVLVVGGAYVTLSLSGAKRRSDARAESHRELKGAMLSSAIDGILTIDREGRVIEINKAAEDMFGYEARHILGENIAYRIVPPRHRDRHLMGMRRHLTGGDNRMLGRRVRIEGLRSDGTEFPLELTITRVDVGADVFFTAFTRDLTETVERERQLNIADSVFKMINRGIIVTDAEARILSINNAFTEITGYGLADVEGETPAILKSGLHDDSFYRDLWAKLHLDGRWSGEIWNKRRDGVVYPQSLSITRMTDDCGTHLGYIGVTEDISARKRDEQRIWDQANFDDLTRLPNRAHFHHLLSTAIGAATQSGGQCAVLFIDLDEFKWLNDSHGHAVGDELLRQVATRLSRAVRANDIVARLGGDEFTILLPAAGALQDAETVARKVLAGLQAPYELSQTAARISGSIGIAMFPEDGVDADTILKKADMAMYEAKRSGRNTYSVFRGALEEHAVERVSLEARLRAAVENDDFTVFYQPIVSGTDTTIVAAEALVRWQTPEGLMRPDKFIPLAEETGLIVPIGEQVLRRACSDVRKWRDSGLVDIRVSVNLSARQLELPELPRMIANILASAGLPPSALKLEITESALMRRVEDARLVVQKLASLGMEILVDDFGTGYSSLAYLRHLTVSALKIDRAFVKECPDNKDSVSITKAVVGLAESLGLEVIAEGVETNEQEEFLRRIHCGYLQGYKYGRPMTSDAFLSLLRDHQDDRASAGHGC